MHTGPKMSVSSIAGDEFRTRNNFCETEKMGMKAKSQMLYQLSYPTSFKKATILKK